MSVYFVINPDGLCVNTIMYNGEDPLFLGEGISLVESPGYGGIGWTYSDGKFDPPSEAAPE